MHCDFSTYRNFFYNLHAVFKLSIVLTVLIFFGSPLTAVGNSPEISNFVVTDVTPVSFSVIWTSSEPSTCGIKVFGDPVGTQLLEDVTLVSMPVENRDPGIVQKAEGNGVMKIRVTGLVPDTRYYFQTVTTSKDTFETSYFPSSHPYPEVITAYRCSRSIAVGPDLVPFANDVINVECYHLDGVTPAEGTILLAYVYGSDYPVSSFVGDGASAPFAYVDINNAFSEDTFENMYLSGHESLILVQYMGIQGLIVQNYGIPCNDLLAEFKPPLVKDDCIGDFRGDGSVDVEDLSVFALSFGLMHDFDLLYIPVWGDLDGDGDVDGMDMAILAADFEREDCPGCP